MLAVVFLIARGTPTVVPTTGTPTVASTGAGACSGSSVGTAATLRVSWTIANPGTGYNAVLYENNIAQASNAVTASMHWDKTISGAIEDGTGHPWTSNWVYRVDVVNTSTNQVVSSASSTAWTQTYGDCTGPL